MMHNFLISILAGAILVLLSISGMPFLFTLATTIITVAGAIWLFRHFNRQP